MDGNKKIKALVYSLVLVVSITACSIQSTSYTGLYIDSDSALEFPVETEVIKPEKVDLTQVDRTDSVVSPHEQKRVMNISSDSVYSKKLIYENTSSLLKNHSRKKSMREDRKSTEGNSVSGSKTKDSVNKISLDAQNKEFKKLQQKITEDKNSMYLRDSSFTLTRAQKLQIVSGEKKTQEEAENYNKANTDRNQTQKTDTVFIVKEIYRNTNANFSEKTESENDDLKKRIERLESQKKVQQDKEPVYIEKEVPSKEVEKSSDESFESVYKEVVRYEPARPQNNRIQPLITIPQQRDTVYIEKEVPVKETIVLENKSDKAVYEKLNSQNDTIKQLKEQLTQKALLQQKTDTIYKINEVPVYKTKEVDSLSITAFYDIGKTAPSNDVMKELKEVLESKHVGKIMLSGYTDASGNQSINKALTDRRLEYIKELMAKVVPVHKIYVQNFGDRFASSEIIPTERRVEIKVYIKPENEQIKIDK
ncbi:OmpA family protein [Psychroflexus sediminis]|uniref:Outer membrane protein OmpA n=1 Tax=Psychroflexus sediminis TaxID=470826 RepID=A0A1G7TTR3_9FLAO|nr:hypothetical protein [Psychroflexus sediminis]SDG38668.1 hypothetical protein SAMN04488027_10150 [Psychroflexus sediminis]